MKNITTKILIIFTILLCSSFVSALTTSNINVMTDYHAPAPYSVHPDCDHAVYPAWRLYNGVEHDAGGGWATVGCTPDNEGMVIFDLGTGNQTRTTEYNITIYNDANYRPKDWTFEGSNDNSTWTVLDTQTNYVFSALNDAFSISTPNNYRYYKIDITATSGSFLIVDELYLSYNESYVPPVVNVNLFTFFKNSTGHNKSNFDEGENFYSFINWSFVSTNDPVNDTVGNCTISYENGIFENESLSTNFLICDHPSCDYSILTEKFNMHQTLNAIEDQIRIYACHPASEVGDLIVNLQCGSNYSNNTLSPVYFPPCGSGYGLGIVTADECLNFEEINITLEFLGGWNSRKLIEEFEYDREFSQYTLNSNSLIFNYTSGFWESIMSTEYYKHGTFQINTTCTSNNLSLFNTFNTSINIANIPPTLILGNLINAFGSFNYVAGDIIQYAVGNFTFFGSALDSDLNYFNITIYNASNGVLFSVSSNVLPAPSQLNLSNKLFRDFSQNPFNISAWANDSTGDMTFTTSLFNVTDTINPSCSGLDSANFLNGTIYNWNVTCTDESFFSINVSCDNSFNFSEIGLNVQIYNYADTMELTSDTTCLYKYCDGHTAGELSDYFIDEIKDKSIKVSKMGKYNLLTPITDKEEVKIEKELEKDRLSFTYTYVDEKDKDTKLKIPKKYSFYYEASENSYYFESEKYKGWIVDYETLTWFDANIENDPNANVIVRRVNLTHWLVDVYSYSQYLKFNSIGELNCIEDTQILGVYFPSPKKPLLREFSTIPQALTYMFFLFTWFGLWLLSIRMKGSQGKPIQLLNLLQLTIGFVVGTKFIYFSFLIGFPVLFVAVGTFVLLLMSD